MRNGTTPGRAPFLLTNMLLERPMASAPARVVIVASNAQALERIDFDDLRGECGHSGARACNQSRLASVLLTRPGHRPPRQRARAPRAGPPDGERLRA